jgi:hypothetical protein
MVVDEAIKAVKVLMVALAVITLLYVSTSIQKIRQSQDYQIILDVEIASGLIYLESGRAASTLSYFDYAKYFSDATNYILRSTTGETYTAERLNELGFGDEPIVGGAEVRGVPMRSALLGQCDAAEVKLQGEAVVILASFILESRLDVAKLSDFTAISFFGCSSRKDEEITGFRIDLEGNEVGYLLPLQLIKSVGREFFDFVPKYPVLPSEFEAGLPEYIRQHVNLSDEYHYLTSTSLRALVIGLAYTRTGRWFSQTDFSSAVGSFFEGTSGAVSWQGVVAPVLDFIRYAPFLTFVVVWEIWRALRRIPNGLDTTLFWLCSDAKDTLGLAGAVMYAVFPALCGISIATLYIVSQGLYLDVFGYRVDPTSILSMNFRQIGIGGPFDAYSAALVIPGGIFILISIVCSYRMISIALSTFANRHRRTRKRLVR